MGALQGYLDPKALPNSLALIPPPPAPGSAAFALDVEVAKNTFALRDTPRFALAASDFELNVPHFVQVFSCALNTQITKENAPYLYQLVEPLVHRCRASRPTPRRTTTNAPGLFSRMANPSPCRTSEPSWKRTRRIRPGTPPSAGDLPSS